MEGNSCWVLGGLICLFFIPAVFNILSVVIHDETLLDATFHAFRIFFLVDHIVYCVFLRHLKYTKICMERWLRHMGLFPMRKGWLGLWHFVAHFTYCILTSYDQSLVLAAFSFFNASNLELVFLLGPLRDLVDAREDSGASGTPGSSTSDIVITSEGGNEKRSNQSQWAILQ